MTVAEGKRRFSPMVWTIVVIGIGFVLGIVFFLFPWRWTSLEPFDTIISIDIVVATISMSLIVSLLFLHARTFSETRARFALGLFIVLGAFLFQSILTSPMFYAAVSGGVMGRGPPFAADAAISLAADSFEAFAFSVFLYLSLH